MRQLLPKQEYGRVAVIYGAKFGEKVWREIWLTLYKLLRVSELRLSDVKVLGSVNPEI